MLSSKKGVTEDMIHVELQVRRKSRKDKTDVEKDCEVPKQKDEDVKRNKTKSKKIKGTNQEENISKVDDKSKQDEEVKPTKRTRGKTQEVVKKEKKTMAKNQESVRDLENLKPSKKGKTIRQQREDQSPEEGIKPESTKRKLKIENLNEDESDQSEDMKSIKKSRVEKAISKIPDVKSQQNEDVRPIKKTKSLQIMKTQTKIHKLPQNPNGNLDLMEIDKTEEKNKQAIIHHPYNTRSKSKLNGFDLKVVNEKDCFISTIPMRNKIQKNKNEVHSSSFMLVASSDIKIENFSIGYESKDLFVNTNLYITYGRRYGLVGPNGCGKTTLLNHLASRMLPLPPDLNIMYYGNCEVPNAADFVVNTITELYTECNKLTAEKTKGTAIQERLNEVKEKLKEITMILKGLGINKETYNIPTNNLSKELRMRTSLARLLIAQPTLLLLDEPTNYLDSDAIAWLEKYLQSSKNTLIIASHKQSFIDNVSNEIIHIDQLKLNYQP